MLHDNTIHPRFACPTCQAPMTIARATYDDWVANGHRTFCLSCFEPSLVSAWVPCDERDEKAPLRGWDDCKSAEERQLAADARQPEKMP